MDLKLKPDVKAKWITALRSGAYNQGTNFLKKKSHAGELRYCCMGVLCQLQNLSEESQPGNEEVFLFEFNGNNVNGAMPDTEWMSQLFINVPANDGVIMGQVEDIIGSLAMMNDKQRYSFSGIADWIENNL